MLLVYRDYERENGYQPSVRELAKKLGVSSLNGVLQVRNRLILRGLLKHSGAHQRARSVVITAEGEKELLRESAQGEVRTSGPKESALSLDAEKPKANRNSEHGGFGGWDW